VVDIDRVRIEVAFDGGLIISAVVPADGADRLEAALGAQEGSFPIDAEDGTYTVVLRRVVYVKRFAREGRVGFGA
jgi:hypothetical protein